MFVVKILKDPHSRLDNTTKVAFSPLPPPEKNAQKTEKKLLMNLM